jgi:hypothetical protein
MTKHISRALCFLIGFYFLAHASYGIFSWSDYLITRIHFIRYLVFPLLLAATYMAVAVLVRHHTRLLIAIYTISILTVLYVVEGYLTNRFYFDRAVAERHEIADVHLGFTPHRLNGYLKTAALQDAMMGHLPFTTVELCSVDYGPTVLDTDRLGLNNPDEVLEQPARVAVIGDSFIHGHCQPAGLDIVSLVRQQVPGTVNLGLTGTGPLFQLAVLGRHGGTLRPDLVVACFYEGNDLRDLPGELRSRWLAGALTPGIDFGPSPAKAEILAKVEHLNRRYAAGEELDNRLMGGLRRERGFRDFLANPAMLRNFAALNLTTSMLGISYGRAPSHLAEYRTILARMREIVEGWGGRLHLCYLPTRHRLGLITSHYAYNETRGRVLEVAADLGISVFDVTGDFAAHPEPRQLYASDGHLSIEGAALVADLMSAYLVEVMPDPELLKRDYTEASEVD